MGKAPPPAAMLVVVVLAVLALLSCGEGGSGEQPEAGASRSVTATPTRTPTLPSVTATLPSVTAGLPSVTASLPSPTRSGQAPTGPAEPTEPEASSTRPAPSSSVPASEPPDRTPSAPGPTSEPEVTGASQPAGAAAAEIEGAQAGETQDSDTQDSDTQSGDAEAWSPWWWVLAALVVAAAAVLVHRRSRRRTWSSRLSAAEAEIGWLTHELLPGLADAGSIEASSGAWAISVARVRGLESSLSDLEEAADDDAGRLRAHLLLDAVGRARTTVEQGLRGEGEDPFLATLLDVVADLESATGAASPASS